MVDTSIELPAYFEPPFREPPIAAGGFLSQPWVSWFTRISDRVADHETRIKTLETEVASILARLTTAGIP